MSLHHDTDPTRPNMCKGRPPGQKLVVSTASVQVLAPNPRRVGVIISNFGPVTAWLSWDEDAEIEKGFPIDSGAVWNFDSGLISEGRLSAITKAASTDLAFQEMNRA